MSLIPERNLIAEKIIKAPQNFKICEVCGSIVMKKAVVCPNCNGYRFNPDKEAIIVQAKLLATREPMSIDQTDYD